MKKYFFTVLVSLLTLTQAFADKGANVKANFIGDKKTMENAKVVFYNLADKTTKQIGPILPRVHLDSGRYNITVYNSKEECLSLSNFNVEDGKTFVITIASAIRGNCGIEETTLKPISKPTTKP